MGLNNPKNLKNGGELAIAERLSPEVAERQMRLAADRDLGFFAKWKVGREHSRLGKETAIQLARDNAQATREIGKTAIDLKKQQIKLGLVAGNIQTIATLQGELFNRYAIAGEEMLTTQAVATKSLIQSRSAMKNALVTEAREGRLTEKEATDLLDEVDVRSAEQEGRLMHIAKACQQNLERLTLNVVDQMNVTPKT